MGDKVRLSFLCVACLCMTVSTCVGPQSGMIYNLRNNLLHKNREKSKVLNNLLLNVKNFPTIATLEI